MLLAPLWSLSKTKKQFFYPSMPEMPIKSLVLSRLYSLWLIDEETILLPHWPCRKWLAVEGTPSSRFTYSLLVIFALLKTAFAALIKLLCAPPKWSQSGGLKCHRCRILLQICWFTMYSAFIDSFNSQLAQTKFISLSDIVSTGTHLLLVIL